MTTMMPTFNETALHLAAIRALEAADLAAAHAPSVPTDGPCTLDEITSQWLSDTLGAGVPGARLEAVRVADEHAGMTDRRKLYLQWNAKGEAAGLPTSVFIKATPDGPYLRETLALLHMAENEVNFYNQVQPELAEFTPRAYYARSYAGGRFLIVMEDLEARDLHPYWLADYCSIDHAKAVVRTQARQHALFWESPRFASDLCWLRPRTRRFGLNWHWASFETARSRFRETDIGSILPPYIDKLLQRWSEVYAQVYAYWDSKPMTLLHGDAHLGNTFAFPDGRAGYFDWQVAFRGYGLRDLAYFMISALTNEDRQAHERDIFDVYLQTLAEHGVILEPVEAWRDYCLLVLDRFDASMKTYTHGGYGHAREATQRQLHAAMGSLQDNDVATLLERALGSS